MPKYIVTVRETIVHSFVAEAPSAKWLASDEAQEHIIESVGSGAYYVELEDVRVSALPADEDDTVNERFTVQEATV